MSEELFMCPECGDKCDTAVFAGNTEFAKVQLGCISCSLLWYVGADHDDFFRVVEDGDSQ
jgi:hypothetical protein